jgi:hypothetical protein
VLAQHLALVGGVEETATEAVRLREKSVLPFLVDPRLLKGDEDLVELVRREAEMLPESRTEFVDFPMDPSAALLSLEPFVSRPVLGGLSTLREEPLDPLDFGFLGHLDGAPRPEEVGSQRGHSPPKSTNLGQCLRGCRAAWRG